MNHWTTFLGLGASRWCCDDQGTCRALPSTSPSLLHLGRRIMAFAPLLLSIVIFASQSAQAVPSIRFSGPPRSRTSPHLAHADSSPSSARQWQSQTIRGTVAIQTVPVTRSQAYIVYDKWRKESIKPTMCAACMPKIAFIMFQAAGALSRT